MIGAGDDQIRHYLLTDSQLQVPRLESAQTSSRHLSFDDLIPQKKQDTPELVPDTQQPAQQKTQQQAATADDGSW